MINKAKSKKTKILNIESFREIKQNYDNGQLSLSDISSYDLANLAIMGCDIGEHMERLRGYDIAALVRHKIPIPNHLLLKMDEFDRLDSIGKLGTVKRKQGYKGLFVRGFNTYNKGVSANESTTSNRGNKQPINKGNKYVF